MEIIGILLSGIGVLAVIFVSLPNLIGQDMGGLAAGFLVPVVLFFLVIGMMANLMAGALEAKNKKRDEGQESPDAPKSNKRNLSSMVERFAWLLLLVLVVLIVIGLF